MSRETQWAALRAYGIPEIGCAAIMGNAEAESGCEPNRLQGDFEITRAASRAYTQMVDDGVITRDDFIYRGPGGGGYGWLQWTLPSRKAGYYANAKRLGVSVGSEEAAVSWLWEELHRAEYRTVLDALMNGTELRAVSDVFLKVFERPADMGEGACAARARTARQMLDQFTGTKPAPAGTMPQYAGTETETETAAEDWDFTVAIQQCCMVRDGYLQPQDVTGKKDRKYREIYPEYAADCAAC